MSTEQFRWATLKTVSNDKGPYKMATFTADGQDIIAHVLDIGGVQMNHQQDSLAFIITPDGDPGRAIAFVLPPPANRTDQQKEGEVTYTNHKKGQTIKMDEDGNIIIKSAGGVVHINP